MSLKVLEVNRLSPELNRGARPENLNNGFRGARKHRFQASPATPCQAARQTSMMRRVARSLRTMGVPPGGRTNRTASGGLSASEDRDSELRARGHSRA